VPSRDLYDEDVISTMAIDNDDFMFNEWVKELKSEVIMSVVLQY
jgi:hypothetical protein